MMYENSISKLRFKGYIADNIYFQLNNEFNKSKEDLKLDLQFDYKLDLAYESKKAIITLGCTVFDECEEKNYPFTLYVSLLGFYEFDGDLNEDEIRKMIKLNGVAILFPYLRATITNITSSCGIEPLIIPTMNISKMIDSDSE